MVWSAGTRVPPGLDYADQRYYSPGSGRFLTADPYQASAGPSDPGSWNRYSYVQGDPVNFNDPAGLAKGGVECGTPCVVTASPLGMPLDDLIGLRRDLESRMIGFVPLHVERKDRCEDTLDDASEVDLLEIAAELASWAPGPVGLAGNAGLVIKDLQQGNVLGASIGAACGLAGPAGKIVRSRAAQNAFRKGLQKLTGLIGDRLQAHHVFPVALQKQFEALGINIWDANNGAWWETTGHQDSWRAYNAEWTEWFTRNAGARAKDAVDFSRDLAARYGFNWSGFPGQP